MDRSIDTRRNRLRRAGAAALLGLVGAALAVPSCSSSNEGSPPAARPAPLVCPVTPADAIGMSCTEEGLRCAPEYTCGILSFSVLCVCTQGRFDCTDAVGNALSAPPVCPGAPEAGTCPRSEPAAMFAPCAEQGLICTYPSVCPGSFDQCQCFPGTTVDGGFGFRYQCTPARCTSSDGAVITFDAQGPTDDAAEGDGGVTDGRGDAPADAANADSPAKDAEGTLPDGSSPSDAPAPDASSLGDGAALEAAPAG